MSESTKTIPVTTYLRDFGCLAFKIADGFTTGIPDIAVLCPHAGTTWLEMKDLKDWEDVQHRVRKDPVQFQNMQIAERCGKAYYVIFKHKIMQVYLPSVLRNGNPPHPLIATRSNNYRAILELVRRTNVGEAIEGIPR